MKSTSAASAGAGFSILLVLLMLAGAQKQVTGNTLDPDVFWHMRVGQQLLRDGIRPLVDEISFNSVRRPWTPYSWLAGPLVALAVNFHFFAAVVPLYIGCLLAGAWWERMRGREGTEAGIEAVELTRRVGRYAILAAAALVACAATPMLSGIVDTVL